ncbi:PIN domain-containing protein [Nocardia sp. NPDC058497]|uniref:PIN domain-containing protein n=1 Tax=Nocardia sp. NPDC058497 TaxID=3346529 RepID=UPI00364F7F7E
MPTIIVLDANIVIASPRLQNPTWQSLVDHRDDWNIRIVVPEVAVMEAAKNVPVRWGKTRGLMPNVRRFREFGHDGTLQAVLDDIDALIASYASDLDERLAAMGVEIVPPPAEVDLMDIARRAAVGRAPYSSGDKDGFRDALIWLSVIELAQDNPAAEVWFVSNNTDDFGPAGTTDWTGPGTGDRDECPILFHSDLIEDLERLGLTERVRYVTNINSLEQRLAAQFAPITTEDLRAKLDETQLTEKFGESVRSWRLDPYLAALDPSTETAVISGTAPVSDSWQFHDGAQREEMGWTARFTVTADTVIAWTRAGALDEIAVQEKKLGFTGDLVIEADGQVVLLETSAVAALPDDPMRKSWPSPADVVRAQQTAARAQEAIVAVLNDAGPNDNPARIMAEVNLWQETAANAKRILESGAVQHALANMGDPNASYVDARRAFLQMGSPADTTIQRTLDRMRDAASRHAEIREEIDKMRAAATTNANIQRSLAQMGDAAVTQADIHRIFREAHGTQGYSEAIHRAFEEMQREARRTHQQPGAPDGAVTDTGAPPDAAVDD